MYQVLIVDDEPIVKIALRSMIDWNELGFHICATASNGEEALEMAGRFHPDLMICDLKMPIMDGIQLIRTAKEQKMECEFLVVSNYEDFDYVRTALVLGAADYMLKVNISPEELTSQLQKIKEKLDQKAIANSRHAMDDDAFQHQERHAAWREFFTHKSCSIEDLASITGMDLQNPGSLSMCQISFDWYIQNLETLPSMDLIRSTFKNALEQFDRRRIIFFSASNTLLLIPDSELLLHQNTIAGLSARIAQLFNYYMSLSPAILYQSGLRDLEAARDAYHQFQDYMELNFYEQIGQLDAGTLCITSKIPDISHKELSEEILKESGDRLSYALSRTSGLLAKCAKYHVLPSRVIQYCIRLLGDLEYGIADLGSAAHDQVADSAEFMRNAVSQEELARNLSNALHSLFTSEISASISGHYSPEVIQALSYIQNNYSRKISLAAVAEHVGLSSGYLCRIFKEETSVSINAYINNLRMTRAGELLKDKNSYIKEVAISVGFEDQLYFSRLFKRYYGMTPSEYRGNQG